MARIGYARVSTIDQDLEAQLAEGCEVVRAAGKARSPLAGIPKTRRPSAINASRREPR